MRRLFGMPYWSFSSWAKIKVKKAVKFISHFQKIVVEEARRSGVDGVICGHIHHAAIEHMDGIEYINTGDWVESCTAVVEHFDGRMEIIRFTELAARPIPDSRALRAGRRRRQRCRRLTSGEHSHASGTEAAAADRAALRLLQEPGGALEPADRHALPPRACSAMSNAAGAPIRRRCASAARIARTARLCRADRVAADRTRHVGGWSAAGSAAVDHRGLRLELNQRAPTT